MGQSVSRVTVALLVTATAPPLPTPCGTALPKPQRPWCLPPRDTRNEASSRAPSPEGQAGPRYAHGAFPNKERQPGVPYWDLGNAPWAYRGPNVVAGPPHLARLRVPRRRRRPGRAPSEPSTCSAHRHRDDDAQGRGPLSVLLLASRPRRQLPMPLLLRLVFNVTILVARVLRAAGLAFASLLYLGRANQNSRGGGSRPRPVLPAPGAVAAGWLTFHWAHTLDASGRPRASWRDRSSAIRVCRVRH